MKPVLGDINRPAHHSEGLNESETPMSVLLYIFCFQGQTLLSFFGDNSWFLAIKFSHVFNRTRQQTKTQIKR